MMKVTSFQIEKQRDTATILVFVVCCCALDWYLGLFYNPYGFGTARSYLLDSSWLAWDNRILGPVYLLITEYLGISTKVSSDVLVLGSFFFQVSALCLFLRNKIRLPFALSWACVFIALQLSYPPNMIWDYIDTVLFVFFAYGVITSRAKKYFLYLFWVGVFNRESVLFIPLYFFIRSLSYSKESRIKCDKELLIFAVKLLVTGVFIILLLRYGLFFLSGFQSSMIDSHIAGNHLVFNQNIHQFVTHITDSGSWCPQLTDFIEEGDEVWLNEGSFCFSALFKPVLISLMALISLFMLSKGHRNQAHAALLCLSMIVSIFVFGNFTEARIYSMCYPLVIFMIAFHRRL